MNTYIRIHCVFITIRFLCLVLIQHGRFDICEPPSSSCAAAECVCLCACVRVCETWVEDGAGAAPCGPGLWVEGGPTPLYLDFGALAEHLLNFDLHLGV